MQGCLLVLVFFAQQFLHHLPPSPSARARSINEASNHVGFPCPCSAVERGVTLVVLCKEEVLHFPVDDASTLHEIITVAKRLDRLPR
jgi:hypothetical protein